MSARTDTRSRTGPRFAVVALLLVLGVAAIYGQTWNHEFLNYDDDTYITANPFVTGPLTLGTIPQAWGVIAANWHPLTWYSHRVDWTLFGPWAGGHHLVSAALHAANAVLLCGVLTAMTGAFWRSAAVAALFALHPLRVESVAWAAERKDVLSALFWICTMGAYLRHARRPGAARYAVVFVLFALGLTAKPMLVTLPFVLLLLDWWPLGRARGVDGGRPYPGATSWATLVLEKSPLAALSVAASLATYWAQTRSVIPMVDVDWRTRAVNAVVSCARYLLSFVWPAKLALLYPFPQGGVPWTEALAAAAALAAITAVALGSWRRRPWLAVGWVWYLGTLVPVIGLVQLGAQSRADRYTYLTMIGVVVALVWTLEAGSGSRPALRRGLAGALCALIAAFAATSAAYVRVWRDSLTLMTHTVAVTRDNYVALNNLGVALMEARRAADALPVFRETVRVNPDHCNGQYGLGYALLELRRFPEALDPLSRALRCYRERGSRLDFVADTYLLLGRAEFLSGSPARAASHFREALAIAPSAAASQGLRMALTGVAPTRAPGANGSR